MVKFRFAMVVNLTMHEIIVLLLVGSLPFKCFGQTHTVPVDTDTEAQREDIEKSTTEGGNVGENVLDSDDDTLEIADRFSIRPPPPSADNNRRIVTTTWAPRLTTTRRSTHPPLVRPGNDVRDYAPSVSFTADSNTNALAPFWNSTNAATLSIRNVRQLTLKFTCNASYPIEWLSPKNYGANKWDISEWRHFEPVQQTAGPTLFPSPFPPTSSPMVITIYTVLLTLTYDKSEALQPLNLICAPSRPKDFWGRTPRLEKVLEIFKENDTPTLYVNLQTTPHAADRISRRQFRSPIGKNVNCQVALRWSREKRFECFSDIPNPAKVIIDYSDEDCYDKASCEHMYSENNCPTKVEVNRNSQVLFKSPLEMWLPENLPVAGVVHCRRDESLPSEMTAALHFFYSLRPICPEDDVSTRQKLYIRSDLELTAGALVQNFVSFCWTPRTYNEHLKEDVNPVVVYIGDNVTVTCIASLYFFAPDSRILIEDRISTEYARLIEPMPSVVQKVKGSFNFTATVKIESDGVRHLICENYLKQSDKAVRKYIPLEVRIPRNVTFKNTQQPNWIYNGQPFQLECEVDGDPPPTITWKKQGRPIPKQLMEGPLRTALATGSILQFPPLEHSPDEVKRLQGTYTCEAQNKLDSGSFTFSVKSPNSSDVVVFVNSPQPYSLWYLWIIIPIIGVVVVAVIGYLVWKIKMQSNELQKLTKAEVDEFRFGRPEFLQHHSSSEEVNNYAPFLPYNKGYEVSMNQLEIHENAVLGSGAYAIVLRGLLTKNSGEKVPVAIKTARTMDDINLFKALLSELKIMGFIGTHPNIVNLVGANTKNIQIREVYIAIEFCENGNLLTYLRDNRNKCKNLVTLNQKGDYDFIQSDLQALSRISFLRPEEELNTMTLVKWSYEVANGMEFLSKKKVIHGDLAARNILLNENLIAKIGDFGLSRQLFEYVNYIKKQQSPLPWKWLAIECLQDMRFSVKSDVWAFGIMLFEIFSIGQVPYPGHSYNDEFLESLIDGKRPSRPNHATTNIYTFMGSCWHEKSEERPNFSEVREFFNKLLLKFAPQEYIELHEKAVVTAEPCTSTSVQNSMPRSGLLSPKPSVSKIGRGLSSLSPMDDNSKSRFSFNIDTKTITAMFHRK